MEVVGISLAGHGHTGQRSGSPGKMMYCKTVSLSCRELSVNSEKCNVLQNYLPKDQVHIIANKDVCIKIIMNTG